MCYIPIMEYYLAQEKECNTDACYTIGKNTMLSEGSQSQKATHCTILFIWSVQSKQTLRDRKKSSGCLRETGDWVTAEEYRVSFLRWWRSSKIDYGYTTLNMLKSTEFVYLKWVICMVCELLLHKATTKKFFLKWTKTLSKGNRFTSGSNQV